MTTSSIAHLTGAPAEQDPQRIAVRGWEHKVCLAVRIVITVCVALCTWLIAAAVSRRGRMDSVSILMAVHAVGTCVRIGFCLAVISLCVLRITVQARLNDAGSRHNACGEHPARNHHLITSLTESLTHRSMI